MTTEQTNRASAKTFSTDHQGRVGLLLAGLIISAWLFHLIFCLITYIEVSVYLLPHIFLQSFLSTGLFIVAHDCMHGSLYPSHHKLNLRIGQLALFLYAGFSFDKLNANHHKHHDDPTSAKDPDYSNYKSENFFVWVWSFGKNYFGLREFLILHLHVILVYFIGGGALWKVFVFYAIPAWSSALQLFYFGTYIPHRGFQNIEDPLKSRSNSLPVWLSLITCYHFGYHREHHSQPQLPWWQLPRARFSPKKPSRP